MPRVLIRNLTDACSISVEQDPRAWEEYDPGYAPFDDHRHQSLDGDMPVDIAEIIELLERT
jgi:hypothetical protein